MSYRRIEINLLPPELQPGPIVRSALIINITMILLTFFTILLTAALSFYRYSQHIEEISNTKQNIASLESVRMGYEQLQLIDKAVLDYGKIIGIASTDYVDIPVLLSRLSHVIPDGVYLTNINNTRAGNVNAVSVLDPARATLVSMTFRTSRKDLNQIGATLNALKADPVFANCALTNASLSSEDLVGLSEALGIETQFNLPNSTAEEQEYNYFEFVIRAEVRRPVDDGGSRIINDELMLFKANNPAPAESGQPAAGTNTTSEPGVVGAPAGVTGQSNRGGN